MAVDGHDARRHEKTSGRVVVHRDGEVVGWWPLADRADLGTVDEIARTQLGAKRLGYVITLEGASQQLRELLELAGISVEMRGQPEEGEERGVEEVVMPDDPVA